MKVEEDEFLIDGGKYAVMMISYINCEIVDSGALLSRNCGSGSCSLELIVTQHITRPWIFPLMGNLTCGAALFRSDALSLRPVATIR